MLPSPTPLLLDICMVSCFFLSNADTRGQAGRGLLTEDFALHGLVDVLL